MPAKYGDEPIVIARAAEVPVIVGISRYRAGRHAQAPFGQHIRGLHLLDDGFQHRQLARNVDIVLVRADDLDQSLLPAGNLREPLSALRRAHFLVIRKDEEEIESRLREIGFQQPIWKVTRTIGVPAHGERCFAFCGIARPQEFFRDLRAADKFIVGQDTFRDHYDYSAGDARTLAKQAAALGADCFLTTAKDAVKLEGKKIRGILEAVAPLHAVSLVTLLEDEPAVVGQLLARLD
jgi:tetraacyldisaccharide 4'-kinase